VRSWLMLTSSVGGTLAGTFFRLSKIKLSDF
jgi:hypothetical protein